MLSDTVPANVAFWLTSKVNAVMVFVLNLNELDPCAYWIIPLISSSPEVPSEKYIIPSFEVPDLSVIPVVPEVAIVKSSASA